ncbi:Nuclear factor erythroid 2-related factor 2 [Manis javanica]|nr:Nuclear factor erythroid 2-related factor 2 [Manis javanica]
MGKIFFAKGELKKAVQLLRKCLMIQILLYGSEHSKSRDTKKSPYSPAEGSCRRTFFPCRIFFHHKMGE